MILQLDSIVQFRSWLWMEKWWPGQNRTDASSLEGYGSTIELQAQSRDVKDI